MHTKRGSNWRLWVLIIALILVIAALAFLCFRIFVGGGSIFPSRTAPAGDNNLSTQVSAQDASGKNVSDKISVVPGIYTPDTVDPESELTLLDISWTGKKEPNYPFIITVTDPAFPDNDGLSVYHFDGTAWELLGTYLIADHSVSFQTDSLSPFALQVIHAEPDPTPTPEPTPEPTPTPEPIDYGHYDRVLTGEYVQADKLTAGSSYIIALVDNTDSAPLTAIESESAAENNGEEEEGDSVILLNTMPPSGPLSATVLINYDGKVLHAVKAEVVRGSDGHYTLTSPVTEGMLWTASEPEAYYDVYRYGLSNNKMYLNLDENRENVVLDDNEGRTRWLLESVKTGEDGTRIETLDYAIEYSTYYISAMDLLNTISGEGTETGEELSFPVTRDASEAVELVLFQTKTSKEADDAKATPTKAAEGTMVPTSTPSIPDATPAPTAPPEENYFPEPITTDPPASEPENTDEPTPTEIPMDNPGGDSTPEPEPTVEPEPQPTNPPDPGGQTDPGGETEPASGSDAGEEEPASDSDAS